MANTEQALNKAKSALHAIARALDDHELREAACAALEDIAALTAASAEAATPADYQIREIGEGAWRRVSKEQMEAVITDPRIDYRVLYAAPQASQPIGQPVSGAMTDKEILRIASEEGVEPDCKESASAFCRFARALLSASGQAVSEKASEIFRHGIKFANNINATYRAEESAAVRDAAKMGRIISELREAACEFRKESDPDMAADLDNWANRLEALASTPAQQTEAQVNVPSGWKLVPVEPTREMWEASGNAIAKMANIGVHHDIVSRVVFDSMLAAAPAPVTTELEQPVQTEAQQSEKDAERYEWLRQRFVGYDFEWGEPQMICAVFEVGQGFRGGRNISEAIDAAIAKEKSKS